MDPKESEPFLRTIAAHPADMTPRLVFADWLDERGEPWGAYIRAAIALTNDALPPAERDELTRLTASLYRAHHRYWNGQLYYQWRGTPLMRGCARENGLRGWRYARGLPETLDVIAEVFAEYADLILGSAPFREVILRHPPRRLGPFLTAHAAVLNRLESFVVPMGAVPTVAALAEVPTELIPRLRIGFQARLTHAEYVTRLSNSRPLPAPSWQLVSIATRPLTATEPGPPAPPEHEPVPPAPSHARQRLTEPRRPPEPEGARVQPPTQTIARTLREIWEQLRRRW